MRSWKNRLSLFAAAGLLLWVWFGDSDERTRGLLLTTMKLSFAVIAISVPSGLLFAWLMERSNVFGRRTAAALLTTMLFIPLYLQAAGWDAGFGRQGWLTLTSQTSAEPLLSGMRAAIWIHTMGAIPWVTLLAAVALRHCDADLEEAALLDHSASWVACHVTIPTIMPAIAVAALWVFVITCGEITVTDLVSVRTFAEEVYTMGLLLDESSAGALNEVTLPRGTGTLLALFVTGVAIAALLVRQPISNPVRPPTKWDLARWRGPVAILLGVAVLLIVGVPLGSFLYNAGMNVDRVGDQIVRAWSPAKVASIVAQTPGKFADEFVWSAAIGALSATASVALGAILGWGICRRGIRAWPALFVIAFGLAVPGPILGLWIVRLFSRPGMDWLSSVYDHSIVAPVLATTIRAVPASVLVCWYGFQSLPPELTEAATVDGLGPFARFVRVIVPLRWRILAAAWLMSFVISTGDLSTSILVTPPGLTTIPVRVFGLLHAGVDDQVAGLCLTIVGSLIVLQLVVVGLLHAARRSE